MNFYDSNNKNISWSGGARATGLLQVSADGGVAVVLENENGQPHHHRSEHRVVVKGMACVEADDEQYFLRQGESRFIKGGVKHRLSNPGKIGLEIIEVQLGEVSG